MKQLTTRLEESAAYIREQLGEFKPEIGIVLGSGWGPVADIVEDPTFIAYKNVPYMKTCTATGHLGRFVFGLIAGRKVCVMQGRLHGYEGYSAQEVAYPIWLMRVLGCDLIITTNAAGAVNTGYKVGEYCLMSDQINFTGRNPLDSVDADKLSFRFVPMLDAFSPVLRDIVNYVAARNDIPLQEGVYMALLGPSFETPAEIRAFRTLGADVVAMSVAEEVIAARHVGMGVIGISLITNMACGIEGSNPSDEEVFIISKGMGAKSADFIRAIVAEL
ncbi:MAG: purine-nucleoside phosphorylase [Eggerthellaceae bacterium]|nr:purine-nucleoside phosphorylase [Eggerthellaceae bacterium]